MLLLSGDQVERLQIRRPKWKEGCLAVFLGKNGVLLVCSFHLLLFIGILSVFLEWFLLFEDVFC